MNPFKEKPLKKPVFETWDKLYPKSYDKREVDPYTKTRIIRMNGTELNQTGFLISSTVTSEITTCVANSR